MRVSTLLLLCLPLFFSCQKKEKNAEKRFSLLPAAQTGIQFQNDLPYSDSLNCYLFRNFYNGGGVGIGDLNNDGLPEVFFCGNLVSNRLYLNKGDFSFEDITQKSGVGTETCWTTGVSIADVNGDGWLDLYLCKSGPPGGKRRANELFINNGKAGLQNGAPTFREEATAWGLDFEGLSVHAAFFDYDRDGDLDCYLLNNSFRSVGGYDLRPGQRNLPDPEGGNRLLRNDGDRFSDQSAPAGIYRSAIGFGLGVTVGDYDRDGWQDLFVSNDFFERDYLYRNKGDGTFEEVLEKAMPEISKGSMGADMADLDNDGFPEIFVTEMTPEGERRYKTKSAFDDWNTYQNMIQTGYHRQFGRNVLQHNSGDGTFSEIGRQAGVWATDWSWGALLADFDNDGMKDIFVANGIGKDLLDQDYLNFYADPAAISKVLRENPGQGIRKLLDEMPSEPVPNYLFQNRGELTFENVSARWGLETPSFSNGAAYGDLDNDGDLDLVVNNVNMPCFVYRNETIAPGAAGNAAHWLRIVFECEQGTNTACLGTKVTVFAGGRRFYQELAPMRGFQSTTDARLHFGLGDVQKIDSLRVEFPSGRLWQGFNQEVNRELRIRESDAAAVAAAGAPAAPAPLLSPTPWQPDFQHRESAFSDFDREPLEFRMCSAEGPCLATADVNGDGLEDVYAGGAAGQPGALFLQTGRGDYRRTPQADFERDQAGEDVAAAFFDADGDGDPDLYVGSGSSEFQPGEPALQDRLYLNNGRGIFTRKKDALPDGKPFATACAAPADVDGDGDQDLFVGMRGIPGHYGQSPTSFILENDGRANFIPNLQKYPALQQLGMTTDAMWADLNGDRLPDLVTCGDWEPVRVFFNKNGTLEDGSERAGLKNTEGWWNCLQAADLDGDGDLDFVLGNEGLNSRFKATPDRPLELYAGDFDRNGQDETILCQYNGDTSFPLVLRGDMAKRLPVVKKRFLKYADYAGKTVSELFEPTALDEVVVRKTRILASCLLLNQGDGQFKLQALPSEAQRAPVYAIAIRDFTGDGKPDILLAGNDERRKPEVGTQLGGTGVLLVQKDNFSFEPAPKACKLQGVTRALVISGNRLWVGKNNDNLEIYSF